MRQTEKPKECSLHTRSPVIIPNAATNLNNGVTCPRKFFDGEQVQRHDFRLIWRNNAKALDSLCALFRRQVMNYLEDPICQGQMWIDEENPRRVITPLNQLDES